MVSAALIAEVLAHVDIPEKIEVRTRTRKKTSVAYVLLVTVSLAGLHSIPVVQYQFWAWTIFELFLTVVSLLPYFQYKETSIQCRRDILPFKVVAWTIAACFLLMIFNVLLLKLIAENFPFRDISLTDISRSNQPTEKFIDLAFSVIPRIGALFPLLAMAKELTASCFIRPERVPNRVKQLDFEPKEPVAATHSYKRYSEVVRKVDSNSAQPLNGKEIQQLVLKENSVPETRQGKDHTVSKSIFPPIQRRETSPKTAPRCHKDSGFESEED